jgi:hypothetical protein
VHILSCCRNNVFDVKILKTFLKQLSASITYLFVCFLKQVSWSSQAVSLSIPLEKQCINSYECVPASVLHFHWVGFEISVGVERGDRHLFPHACSTGT